MKSLQLAAIAISLTALSALAVPASAQDTPQPQVQTNPTTGNPVVVVPTSAAPADQYRAAWVFRNLDDREVRRHRAKGFSDTAIRGAANIALRTGLDLDYILRMVQDAGMPLARIAATYNVSTLQLTEDIPGYGAESFAVVPTGAMMGGTATSMSSSTGAASSASLPPGSGSTTAIGSTTRPTLMGTVVDVAMMDPEFSTLVSAIRAADLVDTLKGAGPYTILAPNNAAWAKLPAGTLDNLLRSENKEKLRSILLYHVVPGRVMAADVMGMSNPTTPTTVNGATLNVKTTAPVMVNDANVVRTDIAGNNGVIHVIDTVLVPAGTDLSATP